MRLVRKWTDRQVLSRTIGDRDVSKGLKVPRRCRRCNPVNGQVNKRGVSTCLGTYGILSSRKSLPGHRTSGKTRSV